MDLLNTINRKLGYRKIDIRAPMGGVAMRYKEPRSMEEIHKIRERHYKETKHLSAKEIVARTHEIVEKVLRERKLTHLKVKA